MPAVLLGTHVNVLAPLSFNGTTNVPVVLLPFTNSLLRYNEYSISGGLAVALHVKVVVFPLQNRSRLGELVNMVDSGMSENEKYMHD